MAIRPWIDPEERITVDFTDAFNLNGEVLNCTDRLVDLALETTVPYYRQEITIPLREVRVSEDRSKYTRNPAKPLRQGRLWLIISRKRPPVV